MRKSSASRHGQGARKPQHHSFSVWTTFLWWSQILKRQRRIFVPWDFRLSLAASTPMAFATLTSNSLMARKLN